MKNQMSFEEYEKLIAELEQIGFSPDGFFPTKEELKLIVKEDIKKELPFLIWIAECNSRTPINQQEKESMRYIKQLLYENLVMV